MYPTLTRFHHTLGTAIRISRQNQSIWSRIFASPSTRRLVTGTDDGKTEKVRTPSLEEINQEGVQTEAGNQGQRSTSDGQQSSSSSSSPAEEEVKKQLEALMEKNREMDDKYKRALAEAENTRIRMRRQVDEAKIFGKQNFGKDLLEVADTLHAAIENFPKDIKDENFKSLFKGVQMTEQLLQNVFRRHGINQINPAGSKFDPNEHHAMFEVEDDSKEPGTVAVVTQIGYKLNERTIRPAMVGVVKAKGSSGSQDSSK